MILVPSSQIGLKSFPKGLGTAFGSELGAGTATKAASDAKTSPIFGEGKGSGFGAGGRLADDGKRRVGDGRFGRMR